MDKEIKGITEEKFVFVDEGASEGLYEPDTEQVVSISDDVFYQELAQDVLENNVQNKVAKEMAAAVVSDVPDETVLFVEEAASDADYALPVVSVNDAAAVADEMEEADEIDEVDEIDEIDEVDEIDEADQEAFDAWEEVSGEAADSESDEETDELAADQVFSLPDEEAAEDDNDEEAYADEADEADEANGDEEYLPVFETHFADDTVYSLRETMDEVFEQPENVYAVEEAEPVVEGKVDIMDYLTDEAKSEIDAMCDDTAAAEPSEAAPAEDTGKTQVFEPVAVESGYVDIDDEPQKLRSASSSSHSGSSHHHHHRRHISKRRIAKGVI
ncbi:MAG: hypothetical protein IIU00_01910, partial [Clostridia bacterium]|nr:hypothetical protein [Clostridia bacterium]